MPVTFKTARGRAQLQEQLTGRQVKGKGRIALNSLCLWHSQLGGVFAVQLREGLRRLQVEDGCSALPGRIIFGPGLRDVGSKYMWHLIRVYEKSRNSCTVDMSFGCV